MNTVSMPCVSITVMRASRFWYSGWFSKPVDLHQRRRVDAFGDLTAEEQIQASRLDDRVEGGVRDEVVDPFAHHGPGALAVLDHLHAAALELLGQMTGEGVHRLVVVVVDVDRLVVQRHGLGPFPVQQSGQSPSGGKLGVRFSKNAVMPSMTSGRNIDSCISFSAWSLAS